MAKCKLTISNSSKNIFSHKDTKAISNNIRFIQTQCQAIAILFWRLTLLQNEIRKNFIKFVTFCGKSDIYTKKHWIYEIIFTFVIKACKCTIPTQYQIWTKNSPIFLILKTNNNKTITKMWNLQLWITTNTNSNKIIGIFAKRGPIYCSQ